MQGDRETSTALTTVKCTYDHEKLLLRNSPLQTTLTSNEGHLLLALIEGVTDKEDLIRRVWGDRGLIVSDSSYYKALHTLRHYLSEVGLDRSVLKTLPRRGVVLLLTIEKTSSENNADTHGHEPPYELPDNTATESCPNVSETSPSAPITAALENDNTVITPATMEHPPTASPPPPRTIRKYFVRKHLFYLALFLGIALPAYYAFMLFSKPVQLERWRLLSDTGQSKLFVELGDKTALGDIVSGMAIFGPSAGTSGTNYYVKKTLSELLVSCEKPESKGEALCTNYLIIEQKK